jgi:phosphoribosylformylglycinamidine cyclo-ligase
MTNKNKKITYKSSGVNIDEGNKLVQEISEMVSSTKRPGAEANLGGFGSIFDLGKVNYKDPLIISATDGVGTKLKFAFDYNKHNTIGIDLVAMCVNDILAQGGDPMFFLDYFATSKLDTLLAKEVIKGITDGCKLAGCALVGGETAELPGFYKPKHYDLAGFCVGLVERDELLPKAVDIGDQIIGLPSSGIHSNGYSLIHKIISENNINVSSNVLEDEELLDLLIRPTKIYHSDLKNIRNAINSIKAIAHITGGGLTENLPRVLNPEVAADIDLSAYPSMKVYRWVKKYSGLDDNELMKTFNCGIGLALVIDKNLINETDQILNKLEIPAVKIGTIIKNYNNLDVLYKGQLDL